MTHSSRLVALSIGLLSLTKTASAQVPDLLNALDAGGRAMATGGANSATNIDTLAAFYNPAALGYLDTGAADLVYRNLPRSRSRLRGSLDSPDYDTEGKRGGTSLTHAGYAAPVRELFGKGSGTLAIAYTVGGYISDRATASTLDNGALDAVAYRLRREAKASFYSLSYGKAVSSGLSYGGGIVLASQRVEYSETGTLTDGSTSFPIENRGSSTGQGLGVIAGALYTPPGGKAWTLGLSVRTPIALSGNKDTSDQYDRIPGRAIFGVTWRQEGFRQGKDYLLVGGQVQSFFGGESSRLFDRNTQTTLGFGAEYNFGLGFGRVPVRFGFNTVPRGGDGYGSRDAFTFGIGVRPSRYPLGLDLSYAVPENGGYDFGIAASYRFK